MNPQPLPPRYIRQTAGGMKEGQRGVFDVSAMLVDHEGHASIDPYAEPLGETGHDADAFSHGGRAVLRLERAREGFKVGLLNILSHTWTPTPLPVRPGAAGWISVVEFAS